MEKTLSELSAYRKVFCITLCHNLFISVEKLYTVATLIMIILFVRLLYAENYIISNILL
jgi:hypothetical protein